ncbi:MAG TPA: SAF domain-containing protein [Actinomycetaceae bacterium]|nr:SAF domain-containing protein [Actinomycetaceae bacterium]
MGHHPPATRRFHRPGWKDPRLAAGVVLVALALVLGVWVVDRASHTVEVYSARHPLAPGDLITADDVVPASVPPGALEESYVPASEALADDAVVTRVVDAGELLPRSAIGSAASLELRPVTVPLGRGVPPGVDKGSMVDLWLTAPARAGQLVSDADAPEPSVLAESLIVAEVMASDSIFSATGGSAAQVLVPRGELSRVLGALAGEREVVVIPVPGSAP